jgi:hypothetical protein
MYRKWHIQGSEWQKIFLGQTASSPVQTEQQLWQDTGKTFKPKYSKFPPPLVNFIHFIIHTEALASRDCEPKVNSELEKAVKVVTVLKFAH